MTDDSASTQRRQQGPATRATRRPPRGPDPDRLARTLVAVWLEVVAGRRGWPQLAPLMSPALQTRLAAQLPAVPPTGRLPRARVVRSHTRQPHDDACESAVIVCHGNRTTAYAVRLERHRGAWRAVELTAPEAGLPALRTQSAPSTVRQADAFDEVLMLHDSA